MSRILVIDDERQTNETTMRKDLILMVFSQKDMNKLIMRVPRVKSRHKDTNSY